ncbi:MAG: glycosyltransferase [Acidimicrobiia bacterium]|nr:glycosyltransferase [Acidimicrobiia bacterium]
MRSVLVVSHSYPLKLAPFKAKFIQDQVLLFKDSTDFKVEVLNLTPKTIPLSKRHMIQKGGFKTNGESVKKEIYQSFPRRNFPKIIQTNISNSLINYLKYNKYDLIHLHWLYPAGLSISRLKKEGQKIVLTIHGSDWYQSVQNPKVRKLVIDALNDVDYILFSGPQLRNDVLNMLPDLEHKTKLIYNFIDSNFYTLPSTDEKLINKKLLNFDSEKNHALTIASLRYEKGVDLLIKAIKEAQLQTTHFHIVGLNEKSEYATAVIAEVRKAGFESFITFHGPKTPSELLNFYHASDYYILPSRREGFNLSILESTATGLPVLCTNVGGNKNVIDDKMGIVVEPENIPELARGIVHITKNFRNFDSKYISKKTTSSYSEKIMKTRLSDIYTELISS